MFLLFYLNQLNGILFCFNLTKKGDQLYKIIFDGLI